MSDNGNSELYKLIKDTIINLQNNTIPFEKYLNVQSKFYKYSVANTILILAQNSNVNVLKDELSWKRESVRISKMAKPINILEPSLDVNGDVMGYNCKKMYDISDTNAKNRKKKYNERTILKAFLHNNIAEIKAVDEFENLNINAKHEIIEDNKNLIYLKRGLSFNDIFVALSRELADIELNHSFDKEMYDFKKEVTAYLVCKSHDIDINNFNIEVPTSFSNISNVKARKELSEIRNAVAKINEGIDDYLRSIDKAKNYVR